MLGLFCLKINKMKTLRTLFVFEALTLSLLLIAKVFALRYLMILGITFDIFEGLVSGFSLKIICAFVFSKETLESFMSHSLEITINIALALIKLFYLALNSLTALTSKGCLYALNATLGIVTFLFTVLPNEIVCFNTNEKRQSRYRLDKIFLSCITIIEERWFHHSESSPFLFESDRR